MKKHLNKLHQRRHFIKNSSNIKTTVNCTHISKNSHHWDKDEKYFTCIVWNWLPTIQILC